MDDLLNHAPCGFLSFQDDGTVGLVNATLLGMLSYEQDDLVGRHVERILTTGSRIFFQTHWFPLLRLHGRTEEIFLMLRSRSGEEIGMFVNAVRREHGGGAAYDCVLMRVRERQKYEDELLRARRTAEEARARLQAKTVELEEAMEELHASNESLLERTEEAERLRALIEAALRTREEVLGIVAHDLRNPVGTVVTAASLLLDVPLPENEWTRQMEIIRRAARRADRLIQDLLDVAQIEAGRLTVAAEPAPVGALLAEVWEWAAPQIEGAGHAATLVASPEVRDLHVVADRDRTTQVFTNLIANAVKFTPAGGQITLSVEALADSVRFSVADTGPGISADHLPHLFTRFWQGNRVDRRGAGLGLSIVRGIVDAHGGDINADSELGRGTTVWFTLPLAREA